MHRITYCTSPNDINYTLKLFRRTQAAMSEGGDDYFDAYPDEAYFRKAQEDRHLIIVKEGARALALAVISHDVGSSFYPETRSEKRVARILDAVGVTGEAVLVIDAFLVDPAFWGQKIGDELLTFVERTYPHSTYLIAIPVENEHALRFFYRHGYLNNGELNKMERIGSRKCYLMVNKLGRKGLASWSH